MRQTGAQILWECLVREGVTHVFGYPGGAVLPVYDAMLEYPVQHVLVRHEQGAAYMADGYARASGRVGVALATSGPGATNLVTGIANAMMDSSPIVCITGQANSDQVGSDAFQETDVTGITLPITKHNYLVTDVNDLQGVLHEAFLVARSGRPGPVLVDICKDVQTATAEYQPGFVAMGPRGYRPCFRATQAEVQRAVDLIEAAERPLILAGQGVLKASAVTELMCFAESTHTPVAMTLLGLSSLPASHPLSLGMMGMHGDPWVNHAIQQADLLIAFGMRFDDRVTGNLRTYAPAARKIHVDIDPSEMNKNVKVDVPLHGDVRETIERLLPLLQPLDHTEWLDHIGAMKSDAMRRDITGWPNGKVLHAAHVIHDIWKFTRGNAVVVSDVGQHQMLVAQYYKFDQPGSLITSGGLGTMGFAVPAAIGAKMARPDADVWAIIGDGGFQMTQAELATIAQEGIKINIAVINNGYLGLVRQWQEFFYHRRYAATTLRGPDFAWIAEAHGLRGIRVTQREEVNGALQRARQSTGTVLIDFRVKQMDQVYPMVPAGADLSEMIRRPEHDALTGAGPNTS